MIKPSALLPVAFPSILAHFRPVKMMSVEDAQANFPLLIEMVAQGEDILLVSGSACVARVVSPSKDPVGQEKAVPAPGFAARRARIFGGRVMPGNIVLEERESYSS